MIEIDKKIQHHVLEQNWLRSEWINNDTPENLTDYILEEAQELSDAVELAMIGDGVFEVASEVGDIGYIKTRLDSLCETQGVPVPDQAEAAWEYAQYIAETVGLDVNKCVFMKIVRNDMKYTQTVCNNGYGYENSRDMSKDAWVKMGGDKAFSNMWMEIADEFL